MSTFPLTWVVVADSTRARIFEWSTANGSLIELYDLIHPEARLRESELTSDRPGMTFDSGGQGQHPKQPAHSAHDNAVNTFAHEIAIELERACHEGKFKRLVLIAPPGFLGQLRPKLKDQVSNKVAESLGLNLTNNSPEAIKARLPRLSSL